LKPVEGKDMLTILSCDPMYPPFTRRILINCVRVDENSSKTTAGAANKKNAAQLNTKSDSSSKTVDYVLLALTILAWIVLIVNIRKFVLDIRRHKD
ncbi:MAG: class C sortase, partial [Finegoldia magna]|nr:class C sortase [Finegoldia magna]